MACDIHDHGAVGDCRSIALISIKGEIDWLCWPRFDSPPLFGSLLDSHLGGCWALHPTAHFESRQAYLGDTNILQTFFDVATGSAVVADFMPIADGGHSGRLIPEHALARRVTCTRGQIALQSMLELRPCFGSGHASIVADGALGVRIETATALLNLRADVPLFSTPEGVHARFQLSAGQAAWLSLTYSEDTPAVLADLGPLAEEALDATARWWARWSSRCKYDGPYRAAVVRSALALKLFAYSPSGAMDTHGPDQRRQIEPPGFFGLHYGRKTPLSVVLPHVVFGVVLGMVAQRLG